MLLWMRQGIGYPDKSPGLPGMPSTGARPAGRRWGERR